MRRNSSNNKMLNICVVALFLAVSFAGCLENDKQDSISPNDVVVNPITMFGGEFQPLVISAKRDVSVFIPHMVVDPASNPSLLSSSFATVTIFLSAINQVLKTSEFVRLPSETIISAGKYPALVIDVKSKVKA